MTPQVPIDSPSRPTIAGKPAWLEAPNFALPVLVLVSQGPGTWRVQLMFPSKDKLLAFHWIEWLAESESELGEFLTCWYASPEHTVQAYFHEEPPKGRIWTHVPRQEIAGEQQVASQKLMDELGF